MTIAPLRILVGADVPPDPNAGAAGTVWQMNQALRRRGHIVDEIWDKDLGRRIRHGNLHYLLELPRAYARAVQNRLAVADYDIVELNQPHAYLAARRRRQRRDGGSAAVFVNRSHGHEVRSAEALAPWREKFGMAGPQGLRRIASRWMRNLLDRQWDHIARDSDGFIVSCAEDARFLAERYQVATERIGVVTQGCSDAFLRTPVTTWDHARAEKLIYVGQLAFFKAPMVLASSVVSILEQRPTATMTWVCGAVHHEAARQLLPASVRERVSFLDWMPQDALITVLDQHGIFLFPSFFEGFGKAPLEAMARGLCVVASATGGMRDYVSDLHNGRLVETGDHHALATAAMDIIARPELAAMLSANARITALAHTWDRCAEEAERFYMELRRRRSSGGTESESAEKR
ncbi:glycosyltransferase family 4 protein [Arenimonas sp.]|uniref:glycosyltransferase family 4 protein n=1 Tax=Arenimonas sp. TaxID=1872635 RepID=UPI0039E6000A